MNAYSCDECVHMHPCPYIEEVGCSPTVEGVGGVSTLFRMVSQYNMCHGNVLNSLSVSYPSYFSKQEKG